jgi:uncharacterized protein
LHEDEQVSDILDLTESMAAPAFSEPEPAPAPIVAPPPAPAPASTSAPAAQFHKIEGLSDVSFDEAEQKPVERIIEELGSQSPREAAERVQLLSAATSEAVDSAFNALAQTVLVQNARTLEDLVREMLRPMLKAWLDDNLPGMVERLVRAEIERVARGR